MNHFFARFLLIILTTFFIGSSLSSAASDSNESKEGEFNENIKDYTINGGEKTDYDWIKMNFDNKKYPAAIKSINEFIIKYPDGHFLEEVYFIGGNIFYNNLDYNESIHLYNLLLNKYPSTKYSKEVKLKLGISYYKKFYWDKALILFNELLTHQITTETKLKIYILKARILDYKANYLDSIIEYKKAYYLLSDPKKREELNNEIKLMIEKRINWTNELTQATNILKDMPSASYALYKHSQILYKKEKYMEAYFLLKKFQTDYWNHEYKEEVETLIKETMLKRDSKIIKIGCIVPLSGESGNIGRKILNGVQLAFFNIPPEDGISLIVKDSSGDPEKVTSAIEEFAEDQNINAIIGPALSTEINTGIKVAEKHKIILLSPTASSSDLSGLSPYFFRNAMTPKNEGEFMAEIAIDYLGLTDMAILYQNDQHGIALKESFSSKFEELGGIIKKTVSFEKDKNDFGPQIRSIGGMSDNKINTILESGEILPDFNFDGVYIPGEGKLVGLILPQLVFYNIENIKILGASGLNSPEFIKTGGKFSNNVIFTDGYFYDRDNPKLVNFVKKYKLYFNDEPDIISAQSYDAANILLELIKNGHLTRKQLKYYLKNYKNYNGISGVTSFHNSGDANKELFLLTVKRGKIRSLKGD